VSNVSNRKLIIAGILSIVVPGLGHLFCGYVKRGILIMIIGFGILLLQEFYHVQYPLSLTTFLYWGWQVYDLVRRAKTIDKHLTSTPKEFRYLAVTAIAIAISFGFIQQYYIAKFYSSIEESVGTIYHVNSDNMQPTLNLGDAVSISSVKSFDSPRLGDIIVFRNTNDKDKVTIQRIIAINSINGERTINTKGDADATSLNSTEYSITQSNYIGKVAKTFSVANAIPPLFKSWIWAQIAASGIAIMIYYINRRQNHEVKHTNP
jgi:signal peptidase I